MWIWISMALAAFSLCLVCWCFGRPYIRVSGAIAAAQALPLRLIWPWVEALALICRPFMPWRLRKRIEHLLQQAGVDAPWTAHHVCALQCLIGLAVGSMVALAVRGSAGSPFVLSISLAVAAVAAQLPVQRLQDRVARRQRAMLREFPFMLDMVTLCVEAGLNLHGALQQAAQNGPQGPLRDELRHMLSDVRAGLTRTDALAQWAQRCELPALHHFIAAVAQADISGMSLGPILRAQADQRRNERFLKAERLALEAPVKMMFPLIFCIFPCSFLIIGFPIAGKFIVLTG